MLLSTTLVESVNRKGPFDITEKKGSFDITGQDLADLGHAECRRGGKDLEIPVTTGKKGSFDH
ncbi:MAG: hypothetical protein IPK17_38760 [Chloroflexi bacterium]|uniref:hypothetical protein n=1 Tax=Candidatus Flexifilum breve TaxID=3140694 RepID=UPI0031358934|nr:hypothetical protein [Chloroflexota bacterium]